MQAFLLFAVYALIWIYMLEDFGMERKSPWFSFRRSGYHKQLLTELICIFSLSAPAPPSNIIWDLVEFNWPYLHLHMHMNLVTWIEYCCLCGQPVVHCSPKHVSSRKRVNFFFLMQWISLHSYPDEKIEPKNDNLTCNKLSRSSS